MTADLHLVLTTREPEALIDWIPPVVREVAERLPACRQILAVDPGTPMPELPHRLPLAEIWQTKTLLGQLWRWQPRRGAILSLGGAPWWALLLAQRANWPVLSYPAPGAFWARLMDVSLLSEQKQYVKLRSQGIAAQQLAHVGNLQVDALPCRLSPPEARRLLGLSTGAPILALVPGDGLPLSFLVAVAEHVLLSLPGTQLVVLPPCPLDQLAEMAQQLGGRLIMTEGGFPGQEARHFVVTPGGLTIRVLPADWHQDALQVADLAICPPSQLSGHLAVLGIPMVATHVTTQAKGVLQAPPNRRAGRPVTPEMIGPFSPQEVADTALSLLRNPVQRRDVTLSLRQTMGPPGAAAHVVAQVWDVLRTAFPALAFEGQWIPRPASQPK